MQKKQDHAKPNQQQAKPSNPNAPKVAPAGGKKEQMGSCSGGDKGKKGGSCG